MFMEIHPAIASLGSSQNLFCQLEVLGTHANVYIAIGPERPFGIHAGRGPTLREHSLDPGLSQQRKDFLDSLFVDFRLQRLETICLMKNLSGGAVSKRSLLDATPAKCGGSGVIEQGSHFIQLTLRDFQSWKG